MKGRELLVPPEVVTPTLPVRAPVGTVRIRRVEVHKETLALTDEALESTAPFFHGVKVTDPAVVPKFDPEITSGVPTGPYATTPGPQLPPATVTWLCISGYGPSMLPRAGTWATSETVAVSPKTQIQKEYRAFIVIPSPRSAERPWIPTCPSESYLRKLPSCCNAVQPKSIRVGLGNRQSGRTSLAPILQLVRRRISVRANREYAPAIR